MTNEEAKLVQEIRRKKRLMKQSSVREKSARTNNPIVSRTNRQQDLQTMADKLSELGMDPSRVVERVRSESRKPLRRSRSQSQSSEMDIDDAAPKKRLHSSKSRSLSRGRTASLVKPATGSGLKDIRQRNKAMKIGDRSQRRKNKQARKGEGDRHIPNLKPKHLFTGIRGIGKTTRR